MGGSSGLNGGRFSVCVYKCFMYCMGIGDLPNIVLLYFDATQCSIEIHKKNSNRF